MSSGQHHASDSPTSSVEPWKIAFSVVAGIVMAPFIVLLSVVLLVSTAPLVPLWLAPFMAARQRASSAPFTRPPRVTHGPLMGRAAAGAPA